jgi:hypothetical protein
MASLYHSFPIDQRGNFSSKCTLKIVHYFIGVEGENLAIEGNLLHSLILNCMVFTLEIYPIGNCTRLLFRLKETLLGHVVHTKAYGVIGNL